MIDTIICNKYQCNHIIGTGKFGVVYKGRHITKNETVAIKTESQTTPFKILRHEATVMNYLYYNGVRNIPVVYWFGQHLNFTCLVMSHYNCNIYDYITNNTHKLGSMMIKCLQVLESIHKHHVLHRDIKPQNFMVRDGDLFLIDFGLSTVFTDDDGKHVIKNDVDNIIGTPKFVSYHNHVGGNISRRDDLMSLGYMYLYLRDGCLPWDCDYIIPTASVLHPKNIELMNAKSWDTLSQSRSLDSGIRMFLKYCYELRYDATPNYSLMMELFRHVY